MATRYLNLVKWAKLSKRISFSTIQCITHPVSSMFFKTSFTTRMISLGPRKLTFGKKTDLEVMMKEIKLARHKNFAEDFPTTFCAELLGNRCDDIDYKMVRKKQPFFLHYRVELLKQRVHFMDETGWEHVQKRKAIERQPPVLVLCFADEGFVAYYVRGLIHCGEASDGSTKLVYFLYKCQPKLRSHVFKIEENLNFVCEHLGTTNERALKIAINMPCFLLWNVEKAKEEFRIMHRDYGLPSGYNLDYHTASVFPPMLQKSSIVNYGLLTNQPNHERVKELNFFNFSDVLEKSFYLPKPKPEDLSNFLIYASRCEGVNENADQTDK